MRIRLISSYMMAGNGDATSGPGQKTTRQLVHLSPPVVIVAGAEDAGPEDRQMDDAASSADSTCPESSLAGSNP